MDVCSTGVCEMEKYGRRRESGSPVIPSAAACWVGPQRVWLTPDWRGHLYSASFPCFTWRLRLETSRFRAQGWDRPSWELLEIVYGEPDGVTLSKAGSDRSVRLVDHMMSGRQEEWGAAEVRCFKRAQSKDTGWIKAFIHLTHMFIHSFLQQIFMGHLTRARHWQHNQKQNKHSTCPLIQMKFHLLARLLPSHLLLCGLIHNRPRRYQSAPRGLGAPGLKALGGTFF